MTVPQRINRSRPRESTVNGNLLSHHAIMELVEPFSRQGYTVDLASSDRGRGVLVFRPVDLPAEPTEPSRRPALRCVLRLERLHRTKFRVIRTLETDDGRIATMTAEGSDPAALLKVVEQVDPARQFHVIDAGLITRSYRAEVSGDASHRGLRRTRTVSPRLTRAEARLGPLRLSALDREGRALEISLIAKAGYAVDVPRDFLAVIGWCWRPLRRRDEDIWLGSVKVPRREPKRTARMETQLDVAATHIAETLAASPAVFHRRHLGARWRATFQRLLPLLFVGGMIVGAILVVTYLPRTPVFHALLHYSAIMAVVVLSLMDKAYRLEVPPPPFPLKQPQWCSASDG